MMKPEQSESDQIQQSNDPLKPPPVVPYQPHPLYGIEEVPDASPPISPPSPDSNSTPSKRGPSPMVVSRGDVWIAQKTTTPIAVRATAAPRKSTIGGPTLMIGQGPSMDRRVTKRLTKRRMRMADLGLTAGMFGLVLTVLEAELVAGGRLQKTSSTSILLRLWIMISTVCLLASIVCYHYIDIKLTVSSNSARSWWTTIGRDRALRIVGELIVCAMAPLPFNITITWPLLDNEWYRGTEAMVPLDAVLSLPMFLRSYLLCRSIVLHDRRFRDLTVKTIAGLNNVTINFTFLLKTFAWKHPIALLSTFTVLYLLATAWMYLQCERHPFTNGTNPNVALSTIHTGYDNAFWCVVISFLAIGYGDIVPTSMCARTVIVSAGIVGTILTSFMIAVVDRNMQLHKIEKNVSAFVNQSKAMKKKKEIAAGLLQHAWLMHRHRKQQQGVVVKEKKNMKMIYHQKKFMNCLDEFKRLKQAKAELNPEHQSLFELKELQGDMLTTVKKMQATQSSIVARLCALVEDVRELKNDDM